MSINPEDRQQSPATARNREPILKVLKTILPPAGVVLEIASGFGEHIAWFAPQFPNLVWQPSAPMAESRHSIAAWAAWLKDTGKDPGNLMSPLELDVHDDPWPVNTANAVMCINMIHISPWATAQALLSGAAGVLPVGGPLYLYGPYRIDGQHTSDSNRAFDEDLKRRDGRWGIRDLADVTAEATRHGLTLQETVAMPSNNFSVIFRKD